MDRSRSSIDLQALGQRRTPGAWLALTALAGLACTIACAPAADRFPVVGEENDVDKLWSPLPAAGYLAFKIYPDNKGLGPITAVADTIPVVPEYLRAEEDTGWSDPQGEGHSDFTTVDAHEYAGNHVDFDWVRENREWEKRKQGWHPGEAGLLTFEIRDDPPDSPHVSGSVVHDHGSLGSIVVGDFGDVHFNRVDVFSLALLRAAPGTEPETDTGLPGESAERAAALDYDLWFVELGTKTSTHGIPEVVFVQGWKQQVWFEDYVARWRPARQGTWNAVAIESHRGDGRDGVCEIDAVIAALVP